MPFCGDKPLVSINVILHRSQASAVSSLLKAVIADGGIGDSVRQHVVKHPAVSRKDSVFRFPPFVSMGKEREPIALQPSQFGSRDAGAALKFRKIESIKGERVSHRSPHLFDYFIDTCFFRVFACILHSAPFPEPSAAQSITHMKNDWLFLLD